MFPKPERILAIRLSAVGDVINTLPAVEALRHGLPDAVIGFLVEDRAYDLLAGHPSVDRVHLYPRRRWSRMAFQPFRWLTACHEISKFIREIRRQRYDVVLDFQGNLKGALHGVLSGVRRRIGFSRGHCKEWNYLFTNIHITPPGGECINRVEKFLSLAAAAGVPVENAGYRIPLSRESRTRVDAFVEERRLNGYVAIHPGTSDFGKAKRWRSDRFSALARRIEAERGLTSVITWGPGERSLAEEIVRDSEGRAILSMETRSILDLAEIIRRARLFIGCDSGPLHLSSAVRTPSVALFGPKDPRIYGPYNPLHRVVYKAENGSGGSMEAITVDDAYRAVTELLAGISELQNK